MTKIANIARNTSYLTLALIIQKIISFSYFVILARAIGPESLGKYYFAISFTTIFAICIDLGFINFLTREVAKHQERAGELLNVIAGAKIILALLTAAISVLVINLLGYDGITRDLVYISMICMVLDSFTTTFFAVARGFHNLKYESISSVIYQLVVLVFGSFVLWQGWDLRINMATLSLASIFNFVYSWLVVNRKLKLKIVPHFNWLPLRQIIIASLPFAVFAIFQRIYTYLDSVMLSKLAGDYYVGIYQASFKIIFALQFLPMAFTASLYPAMSAYWLHNRDQLKTTFSRSLDYLTIISVPISLGAIILARPILALFGHDYAVSAVLPLRLTMAAIFFQFIGFSFGSFLNACDQARRQTTNMIIVTIASVALNIWLIPHWQAVGASATVLVTNILMFILGATAVKNIMPYNFSKNASVFLKSFFAAAIMSGVVLVVLPFGLMLSIIAGGLVYPLGLFLLGGFKKADIEYIIRSFRRRQDIEIDNSTLS